MASLLLDGRDNNEGGASGGTPLLAPAAFRARRRRATPITPFMPTPSDAELAAEAHARLKRNK